MKRNIIGKIKGVFIVIFYCLWMIAGLAGGVIASVYISCVLTGNTLDMKYFGTPALNPWGWLWFPGMLIGSTCAGMPLFVLSIKPFYTREAIIELINRYPAPYYSKSEVDTVNGIGFFWLNLLYPEKDLEMN